MSGAYVVTGSGENGTNPYEGILNVTNQQDVYLFKWQTTRPKPGGVGVQMGDAVAVSYADPTNGKGCGVALYRIAPDGSLDGKIARWGEYKFGTEKATRIEGDKFEGKYKIAGTASRRPNLRGHDRSRKKRRRIPIHLAAARQGFRRLRHLARRPGRDQLRRPAMLLSPLQNNVRPLARRPLGRPTRCRIRHRDRKTTVRMTRLRVNLAAEELTRKRVTLTVSATRSHSAASICFNFFRHDELSSALMLVRSPTCASAAVCKVQT